MITVLNCNMITVLNCNMMIISNKVKKQHFLAFLANYVLDNVYGTPNRHTGTQIIMALITRRNLQEIRSILN